MGYFATPIEYDAGGYESQLTMWGITTAAQIRKAFYSGMISFKLSILNLV
jgi:hypothetical protein